MTKFVLIIVMGLNSHGPYTNTTVSMQEFDSKIQCEYAAKIIRENGERVKMAACIYK